MQARQSDKTRLSATIQAGQSGETKTLQKSVSVRLQKVPRHSGAPAKHRTT
jgi:hypothetical protein